MDMQMSDGLAVIKISYKSPNLNAHCEHVSRTVKLEALDYFMVYGEDLLDHIVSSFVEYYNMLRP